MRILIALATATLFLTACGGDAKKDVTRDEGKTADAMSGPIGAPSVPTSRLDFASCLAEDVADDDRARAALPFVRPALARLHEQPVRPRTVASWSRTSPPRPGRSTWTATRAPRCSSTSSAISTATAHPGAFACGSTGCPFLLYKKREDDLGRARRHQRRRRAPPSRCLPAEEGKLAASCAAAASASSPAASTRITSGTGAKYDAHLDRLQGPRRRHRTPRPHDADQGLPRLRQPRRQEGPGARRVPRRHDGDRHRQRRATRPTPSSRPATPAGAASSRRPCSRNNPAACRSSAGNIASLRIQLARQDGGCGGRSPPPAAAGGGPGRDAPLVGKGVRPLGQSSGTSRSPRSLPGCALPSH